MALDNMRVLMAEDASMIKSILCEIWVLKALEELEIMHAISQSRLFS